MLIINVNLDCVKLSLLLIINVAGIIGGGVGGTSTAYFLRELFPLAQIDIFEKSGMLGGRLNVTMVFGNGYETGGSIIHGRNKYAVELADKFGKGCRIRIVKGHKLSNYSARVCV